MTTPWLSRPWLSQDRLDRSCECDTLPRGSGEVLGSEGVVVLGVPPRSPVVRESPAPAATGSLPYGEWHADADPLGGHGSDPYLELRARRLFWSGVPGATDRRRPCCRCDRRSLAAATVAAVAAPRMEPTTTSPG